MRISDSTAMRITRSLFVLLSVLMSCSLVTVFAVERTWTRSELLTIADNEVRRLRNDHEAMSISFGSAEVDGWCLSDLRIWAIHYRSLNPLTTGGDFCIVIDRETGNVVETKVGE